jgi:hypothetical protein
MPYGTPCKEGFERTPMVEAILEGNIIEKYRDEQRVLICGKTTLAKTTDIYLHVVCEYADALYGEFVTAYIPDVQEWESPPIRRRARKRR